METAGQATITKEQISQYKQQRMRECSDKLTVLLQEYDCDLVAEPEIKDGHIVAKVGLVAK